MQRHFRWGTCGKAGESSGFLWITGANCGDNPGPGMWINGILCEGRLAGRALYSLIMNSWEICGEFSPVVGRAVENHFFSVHGRGASGQDAGGPNSVQKSRMFFGGETVSGAMPGRRKEDRPDRGGMAIEWLVN
jgi:hypothetical protein